LCGGSYRKIGSGPAQKINGTLGATLFCLFYLITLANFTPTLLFIRLNGMADSPPEEIYLQISLLALVLFAALSVPAI
jgi:hypothetical protein